MSQPPAYTPTNVFPSVPYLDAELADIEETIDAIVANLRVIQRDDLQLADSSVQLHALGDSVLATMANAATNPRGAWLTATLYAVKDIVSESAMTYMCVTEHTSGTFATDLAAVKWLRIDGGYDVAIAAIEADVTAIEADVAAAEADIAALEADAATAATAPTVQTFLSGSGTYTTPANVRYLRVQAVGGGAGGNGGGIVAGASGAAGANTTFGTSLITAGGAPINGAPGSDYPGAGGTGTINSPAYGNVVNGGAGSMHCLTLVNFGATFYLCAGGKGGDSVFNGGGRSSHSVVGEAATANTGGGGGGGGSNVVGADSAVGGQGGGAGGYVDAIIPAPAATYSYSVGAGGAGGAAGSVSDAGGAGGSGKIVVWEFYA